jgi:hypothetical protein
MDKKNGQLPMKGALRKKPRSGKGRKKDGVECPIQEYDFFVARQGEKGTMVTPEEEAEADKKEDSGQDKSMTFFLSE